MIARASGLVAFLLLTGALAAGLLVRTRLFGRSLPPRLLTAAHGMLSGLGLALLAVHGLALLADRTVEIPLRALLVPGASPYRPLAVSCGVLAGELWLALQLSSLLRGRIGAGRWRLLHRLALPAWLLGAGHGLFSGSDSGTSWVVDLYAGSAALVAGLLVWRVWGSAVRRPRRQRRR